MAKSKYVPPSTVAPVGPAPTLPPLSSTSALGDDTAISSLMRDDPALGQAAESHDNNPTSGKKHFWGLGKHKTENEAE